MSDSDDEQQYSNNNRNGAGPGPAELNNKDLPSLFWDTMPENPEDHPDYQAMMALREEQTPEERAEAYKKSGNEKLKIGLKSNNKILLREAVGFYTQGIQEHCGDAKLNSVLYSNRAHVESLLGNWRKALHDSREAANLDPSNVKALFRGARAALRLGELQISLDMCKQGQAAEGGASAGEFAAIAKDAEGRLAQKAADEERVRAAKEAETAPARALADAITSRGWRVTVPQVRTENSSRPWLEPADASVHWPSLFMYPESMQQDSVEDFSEHNTFAEHLDAMFGPDAPPLPWDEAGEYSRQRVELYYLSNAGKPLNREQLVEAMQGKWPEGFSFDMGPNRYGEGASRWRRIKESWTLAELLAREDYVVPGLPLFFVVAAGTEYRERFLTQEKQ